MYMEAHFRHVGKKTLYDSLTVVVDKLSFNFKSRNSEIPN